MKPGLIVTLAGWFLLIYLSPFIMPIVLPIGKGLSKGVTVTMDGWVEAIQQQNKYTPKP